MGQVMQAVEVVPRLASRWIESYCWVLQRVIWDLRLCKCCWSSIDVKLKHAVHRGSQYRPSDYVEGPTKVTQLEFFVLDQMIKAYNDRFWRVLGLRYYTEWLIKRWYSSIDEMLYRCDDLLLQVRG